MWSNFQVKTVTVLALICLLQCSVSGIGDVIITVKFDETSNLRYNVNFDVSDFRFFYDDLCKGAQDYATYYLKTRWPNGIVLYGIVFSRYNYKTIMPVYHCENKPARSSLHCHLLSEAPRPGNYVQAQSFRLDHPHCSRYVTLVWYHEGEGLTVNADILDLVFCDPAFDCSSTTRRTEGSLSEIETSSSSTTTNHDDKDDDNQGLTAGLVVAALIAVIVVVIVVVWWKRRKKQDNKEPGSCYVNSPLPAALPLSYNTPAADPSPNVITRTSQNASTSPSEPTSTASAPTQQNDYSQLDVSNTNEHAYASLSLSPYYSSTSDMVSTSTKGHYRLTDTSNSTTAYSHTPGSTPISSSGYSTIPTMTITTEYSNTQRSSNIIPDQPETEGAYEEADFALSIVRGDYVN